MKTTITRAGAAAKKKKGLIIVNTGDGKGKTTAALGLALRACGYGMKVIMLQFFKGKWKYGELRSAPKLGSFEIQAMGQGFTWESKDVEVDKAMVRDAWRVAKEKILSGNYDVVILDEINYALSYGILARRRRGRLLADEAADASCDFDGARRQAGDRGDRRPGADLVTEMRSES